MTFVEETISLRFEAMNDAEQRRQGVNKTNPHGFRYFAKSDHELELYSRRKYASRSNKHEKSFAATKNKQASGRTIDLPRLSVLLGKRQLGCWFVASALFDR